MSKHNHNLSPSLSKRCKCGRYITLGEEKAGIGIFNYECPDCTDRKYAKPLTREEFYEQFKRVLN